MNAPTCTSRVTGIPDSVDLWLALARLESYEKARKVCFVFLCVLCPPGHPARSPRPSGAVRVD